jgi:serine/threonine protein kinase
MGNTVNIPGYRIKKELGTGGMARVYLALEEKLGRPVALKVLSPSIVDNPRITRRFFKEAKIAAHLEHSNIVSIYDVGTHGGLCYIAMEYLKDTLKDRIKRIPAIKPREALQIMKEVAKALAYAHHRGYVHRDIKPENIMFRKDGAVVLVDFGIVKAVNEKERTRLTRTGMSIGTPQYMSPEQIKARKVDGRSDIYSLGIVLYETLTGRVPFDAEDVVTLALQHTGDPIPRLPNRFKDFQPLMDKMLAKTPGDRVRTAEGLIRLIDALDFKLKKETTTVQKKTVPPPAKKRRALPVFALLAVVVLIAGSFFLIMESRRKHESTAWQKARTVHTITAYREYLSEFPEGRYQEEAGEAIKELEKDSQYRQAVKQAEAYFRQGNYRKALEKAAEAKKIKSTRQLELLEKQIKKAISASGGQGGSF